MKNIYLLLIVYVMLSSNTVNAENMQAYFADFMSSATLEDINSDNASVTIPPEYSTCAFSPPNVVFTAGFTSGLAYRDDVLYGLSWSGEDISLYSMSSGPCAIGSIITPITGLSNLESLAYCADEDMFYSADFDFPNHIGQLAMIDPTAQNVSLIGSHMSFDVRITGMVCDSSGQLWAATPGHGGRSSELLKINRISGVETVVGATGIAVGVVEALAIDRDKPSNLMYINGSELFEVNKSTGNAISRGGSFAKFYAMAGLPASDIIFAHGFEAP